MTTTDVVNVRPSDSDARATSSTKRHRTTGRPRRAAAPVSTPPTNDGELVEFTGLGDMIDTYAFIRTSGYLPGANYVYGSARQIPQYGLRRGGKGNGPAPAGPPPQGRRPRGKK